MQSLNPFAAMVWPASGPLKNSPAAASVEFFAV